MKVLHYILGFPPYRSGGLTRYVIDLMECENKLGLEVYALYPESMSMRRKKCDIQFDGYYKSIPTYKMVNPLPVSLLYGIASPKDFYNESDIDMDCFIRFLDVLNPEIIHLHTLMGLPKCFLSLAHQRNIRIVYTTHDFNGLCPKVNFIDQEGLPCNKPLPGKCQICNKASHGTFYLKVRNIRKLVVWLKKIKSLF